MSSRYESEEGNQKGFFNESGSRGDRDFTPRGGDRDRDRGGYDRDRGDRGGYGGGDRGGYGGGGRDRGGYGGGGGYDRDRGGYGGGGRDRGGYGGGGGYDRDRGGYGGGGGRDRDRGYDRPPRRDQDFDSDYRRQRNFKDRDGGRGGFDQQEVYSQRIKAGKRTYMFDVRATRNQDYYITITERKRHQDGTTAQKQKIFVYKEDFNKFIAALEDVVNHVKTELLPDYDYDRFARDDEDEAEGYDGDTTIDDWDNVEE